MQDFDNAMERFENVLMLDTCPILSMWPDDDDGIENVDDVAVGVDHDLSTFDPMMMMMMMLLMWLPRSPNHAIC